MYDFTGHLSKRNFISKCALPKWWIQTHCWSSHENLEYCIACSRQWQYISVDATPRSERLFISLVYALYQMFLAQSKHIPCVCSVMDRHLLLGVSLPCLCLLLASYFLNWRFPVKVDRSVHDNVHSVPALFGMLLRTSNLRIRVDLCCLSRESNTFPASTPEKRNLK